MTLRPGILCAALAIVLAAAAPAAALIIASGDGTGNTTAPADDPGWANVGTRTSGLTVLYVGNGWVLTAAHVGAGDVVLAGQVYAPVPGSERRLRNPDSSPADLLLFRIQGFPPLPLLPLAHTPPATYATATLIGAGLQRGAPTSWNGISGFLWGSAAALRWGTARVVQVGADLSIDGSVTRAFATTFTPVGLTSYPAQAAVGDSGGAAFVKESGVWVLAGVLFAIDGYDGQPAETALYGNQTFAADLSFYRAQITSLVTPSCGLGFELALLLPPLLVLHRRRSTV